MASLALPPTLQARLDGLPRGLALHVDRVRGIARELATAHAIDPDLADLTAAAHDVARHIAGDRLIEEADRLGIAINAVEPGYILSDGMKATFPEEFREEAKSFIPRMEQTVLKEPHVTAEQKAAAKKAADDWLAAHAKKSG